MGNPATVTDAAGTRNFAYNADFDLTSESISGIYNKVISRTYTDSGAKGRPLAMSLDGVNNYTYGYDTYGRLNQIATPAGNFNYSYSDGKLIHQITRPNNVITTFTYESDRNLVTQVANGAISIFNYANNAIGNRTSMGRNGSAFTTPDTLSYGYNDRSEVISAHSNNNASYNYSYGFDPIGNRLTANLAGLSFNYTSNNLNQYTVVNTDTPTYDFDGNTLINGAWTYTWNGENRMIAVGNGSTRLEFTYDYMGRRVEKKVYDGETLSKHTKFVYNGFKLVEELDALNENATLRKYTWQPEELGLDVPLLVYDATLDATYFYATDANKNVSEVTNGTGTVVAHYEFSPSGTQTASSGVYVTSNPFHFSAEYFDSETQLVYYNYRYFDPQLGRWLSRDPIGEKGENNLYDFVNNNLLNKSDRLGLFSFTDWIDAIPVVGTLSGHIKEKSSTGVAASDYHHRVSKKECCAAKRDGGGVEALEHACAEAIRKQAVSYFVKANTPLAVKTGVDAVAAFASSNLWVSVASVVDGLAGVWAVQRSGKAIDAARDQAIKENCKCP